MTLENGILNRKSGFRNPRNFCLWNPESWAFESGIQLKESGIPLTIGIQNLSSTDKDWNPVPGIRNPRSGIQNPRLSWILLVRRFEARVSSKDCATVLATKEVKRCNKYIVYDRFWIPDTLWLHCRSWCARKTTISKRRVRNEQQHNKILISLTMCFYYNATRAYGG